MPSPWVSRVDKIFRKTITFAGGTGTGAAGTVAVATVTGGVIITKAAVLCTTLLATTGAATIEIGTANDTAGLFAQITATTLDASEWWEGTPSEVAAGVADKTVTGNIILTVATADVSSGVITVCFYWRPITSDGNIA